MEALVMAVSRLCATYLMHSAELPASLASLFAHTGSKVQVRVLQMVIVELS